MNHNEFKYPLEIFWSDEDHGYIATVPDFPGCSAMGETEADAIREVHHAATAWMKAAKKARRPIPKPSLETNFNGKVLLRLPKRLHAELARAAKQQGVSLNQYLLFLLAERKVADALIASEK